VNFHPVDVASLGRDKVAADHFLEDVFIRSESFLSIVAMAGPYYQYPVGKNFSLTGKLLCGLLYGQTPYQLYKPDFFGVSVPYYEITQAKDWKFAWLAGAALSYEISACVDLAFDADVMYNKLEFNFQTATDIRTEKRTFAIVNLTLGLRIKI